MNNEKMNAQKSIEQNLKKYIIYINDGYCFGTDNKERAMKKYNEIEKEQKLLDTKWKVTLIIRTNLVQISYINSNPFKR